MIIPLGDIQLQQNRKAVDVSLLKDTIAWGVEHNALWLGMGDYIDNESPSNRRTLRASGLYDSVMDALDAKSEELEEELQEMLKPTVGRWLGVLDGHHYHEHQDGTTSDTRLAKFLKCPFLGTSAYVNLQVSLPNKHGKKDIVIWAHHGRGGGELIGAPLSKLEKMVLGFDADLYIAGHTHKAGAAPINRIYPYFYAGKGTLHHKKMYVVSAGAFLKGYVEGHQRNGRAGGLYPEESMMRPLSLGCARIWLRPTYTTRDGRGVPDVEISVEV